MALRCESFKVQSLEPTHIHYFTILSYISLLEMFLNVHLFTYVFAHIFKLHFRWASLFLQPMAKI